MEVTKSQTEDNTVQVEMPNLTGITLKEAKEVLKDMQIEYEADTDNNEAVITKQLPKRGIKITNSTKVYLYSNK